MTVARERAVFDSGRRHKQHTPYCVRLTASISTTLLPREVAFGEWPFSDSLVRPWLFPHYGLYIYRSPGLQFGFRSSWKCNSARICGIYFEQLVQTRNLRVSPERKKYCSEASHAGGIRRYIFNEPYGGRGKLLGLGSVQRRRLQGDEFAGFPAHLWGCHKRAMERG